MYSQNESSRFRFQLTATCWELKALVSFFMKIKRSLSYGKTVTALVHTPDSSVPITSSCWALLFPENETSLCAQQISNSSITTYSGISWIQISMDVETWGEGLYQIMYLQKEKDSRSSTCESTVAKIAWRCLNMINYLSREKQKLLVILFIPP